MNPPRIAFSRILIGPTEVAGFAQGLQQGFAQLGVFSELVLECQHPFGYAGDEASSPLVRVWKWAGTMARAISMRQLWLKAPIYALHLALGWLVMFWALMRYDAFVFLCGKTLTNTRLELWLLRALGKPAVVIFIGSDARPAYINGAWLDSSPGALRRRVRRQKHKVRWLERLAAACVNAPGTAHFHEREVVNWFVLGFPRVVAGAAPAGHSPAVNIEPVAEHVSPVPVRVVHSPSNAAVKGTAKIQSIVENLRRRGFDIDFVLLKGLANEEVLAALRTCDLVVDQLYSDTPMAGLATESALLGKPALVGGYFARDMPLALGGAPVPPTRFVAPERFEQALEDLVSSASKRAMLGGAALTFVQSEWSCQQVAGRMLRILRGDVPANWQFNPVNVRYLAGCGLPEDAARMRVRQLIDHCGVAALQLTDKPALEQAFVNWARNYQTSAGADFDQAVP